MLKVALEEEDFIQNTSCHSEGGNKAPCDHRVLITTRIHTTLFPSRTSHITPNVGEDGPHSLSDPHSLSLFLSERLAGKMYVTTLRVEASWGPGAVRERSLSTRVVS
jgi:hypothetical protein